MLDELNAPILRLVEGVRMKEQTALLFRLLFFERNAMFVCIGIVAYAGDLP